MLGARFAASEIALALPAAALLLAGVLAPAVAAARDCPDRPDYTNLRWEEDWGFLADPLCATQPVDRLKFIPMDEGRERFVSLGGEARLR